MYIYLISSITMSFFLIQSPIGGESIDQLVGSAMELCVIPKTIVIIYMPNYIIFILSTSLKVLLKCKHNETLRVK